jgi:hypothetical protein
MYASLLGISGALYLGVFEQPASTGFFSNPPGNSSIPGFFLIEPKAFWRREERLPESRSGGLVIMAVSFKTSKDTLPKLMRDFFLT